MDNAIKLFCIPYAGGSEYFYSQWSKKIDHQIRIVPILLKGRNSRYNHKYQSFNEMVEDVFEQIVKEASEDEEISLFGHSMGGILTYEVSKKLEKEKYNLKHIFLSGINHPNEMEPVGEEIINNENYLIQKLLDLGGIQDDLLKNKDAMDYFFPIIKQDFLLIEEYKKSSKSIKQLSTPISILNGKNDKSIISNRNIYNSLSHKEVLFYTFNGDHFYINQHLDKLIHLIEVTLVEKNLNSIQERKVY